MDKVFIGLLLAAFITAVRTEKIKKKKKGKNKITQDMPKNIIQRKKND